MRFVLIFVIGCVSMVWAGNNTSASDHNATMKNSERSKIEKAVKEQMEREKKYAKEQKFYEGKEYDLKSRQVDPDAVKSVPIIKPEDDFDMSDVYSD